MHTRIRICIIYAPSVYAAGWLFKWHRRRHSLRRGRSVCDGGGGGKVGDIGGMNMRIYYYILGERGMRAMTILLIQCTRFEEEG